ncbi:MAG: DnaJ domain-containing protein [Myxococcales bacterium]|nr:DnaJ domain-containing protein [Myxococcales bacterium]MDH5565985.1 DnaJ domain-containing protein [Myxococcales bacterium]
MALTPVEGFLLSRMDGRTSWLALRQIGGVSPEQVDQFLERWVEAGAIEFVLKQAASPGGKAPAAPPPAIDPSLELPEELQQRILDYEARLDGSYHELLGVDRGADNEAIKRAYFALSKQFHPDRYFRKNIGPFGARLERLFKKMIEAYELLSDPATRSELERSMDAVPPDEAGTYRDTQRRREVIGAQEPAPPGGYRKPTPMENLARLRRRFRIPKKLVAERQFKARQLFQAAQVSAHQDRWIEASASMRLAIAFDPWNPEYKDGFGKIQAQVHGLRARALLDQAENAGSRVDAMRMLEEALGYRPMDPETNTRAARLALELGELDRAREYAETLVEIEPKVALHHVLLSRALRRSGRTVEAQQALDRAASIDPQAPEVKAERLKSSQRFRRR